MSSGELAALLDQSQYPFDLSDDLQVAAQAAGLVVIFGASDDLMEFRGAIQDEVGAYEGAVAFRDVSLGALRGLERRPR